MTTITPEIRQAIEQAGDQPVRMEDPETKTAYILVKEEVYRQLKEGAEIETIDPSFYEFGEFIPLEK